MLGSAAEAEDVVQDAWLRSSTAETVNVRSPRAYLMTVVTRLALDRLKSARAAREQYIGPWLPEPVLTDGRSQPEESVALAESLTLAFMVLLDTLSPEERAVFVLREVLEYSYAEIAPILNGTEANCRQLFHKFRITRVVQRRLVGRNVLVEAEHVVRVVPALERLEAVELRWPVRLPDPLLTLVHQEVHIHAGVVRGER
jgi:RNA polymerase sigma factor (sigma-70 family)